jgi:hypothetical protein
MLLPETGRHVMATIDLGPSDQHLFMTYMNRSSDMNLNKIVPSYDLLEACRVDRSYWRTEPGFEGNTENRNHSKPDFLDGNCELKRANQLALRIY